MTITYDEAVARYERIVEASHRETLTAIAAREQISRERVRQIIDAGTPRRTGRPGSGQPPYEPTTKRPKTYPLDEFEVRAFSNAIQAAKKLRAQGTRQPHGIGPNRPLTRAQRRDVDIIERAATRLFDLDAKARR